jgi:hypothetical protein
LISGEGARGRKKAWDLPVYGFAIPYESIISIKKKLC